MYNLSTSLLGCNAHILSLFSLISCPHLSIHSLSTAVFLLHIWIQPLPKHLLLLFCFSHLVLILAPVEAFTYISLFFFHFILFDLIQFNYVQICVFFLFDLLHYFTIWELYSFTSNYSLFMVRIPYFFSPNSILISVLKTWTALKNYSWKINDSASTLFSPFTTYIYLSKYQQQRWPQPNENDVSLFPKKWCFKKNISNF